MAVTQGTTFSNPVPVDFATFTFSGQSTASLPVSYLQTIQTDYPDVQSKKLYILLSNDTTTPITSSTLFTFADNNARVPTVTAKGYKNVLAQRIQKDVTRAECRNGQAIAIGCYSYNLNTIILDKIVYKPNCTCTC